MTNRNEMTPEAQRVLDRLVKAGWLENVRDNPSDPNKGLLWYVDANEPANCGYPKLLAFYKLHAELCKSSPMTTEDLEYLRAFTEAVRESNRAN